MTRDPTPAPDITRLLHASAQGDDSAREQVASLLYAELLRNARQQRYRHRGGQTLNTTALVHEAFLRLSGPTAHEWQDRLHFLRTASRVMRNVLVDHARRRHTAKRGGGAADLPFEDDAMLPGLPEMKSDEVLAVHDALLRLEAIDPRQAQVVELRYFVGLDVPETAEVLGISPATVKRDWTTARAWLQRELERES